MMPFDVARRAPGTLVEITKGQHDEMLGTLPPIWARGCFAMGEPIEHTPQGVTFLWAGRRGDKHYTCYGTRAQAESAFASAPP
jgi:hypothetical protein